MATSYHHMPETSETPDIDGLTLRRALRALRMVSWGDMGGCRAILDDGREIAVELEPATGGGSLTRTQRAVVTSHTTGHQRTYQIKS